MWLLICQLIYVIPSVALYVLIIVTIVSQWNSFKSSFLQFYIFDFAMVSVSPRFLHQIPNLQNMFTLLNTFYVLRFSNYTCDTCLLAPIFQNLDKYVNSSFMYAVQYHMAYVQYLNIFVASLNRLFVISNFSRFEPLWRKYSFLAMMLIILLPTPNTVWMMTYGAWWVYEETGYRYMLHSPVPQSSISLVLVPFMVISNLLSLILNSISMVLVRRVSQQKKKTLETHFLKLIVITCAVQLVGTILVILIPLATRPSLFFTIVLYSIPFGSDCLTLCHPWLLLSLSKPIRDSLLQVLRPTPTSSSVLVLVARREANRL